MLDRPACVEHVALPGKPDRATLSATQNIVVKLELAGQQDEVWHFMMLKMLHLACDRSRSRITIRSWFNLESNGTFLCLPIKPAQQQAKMRAKSAKKRVISSNLLTVDFFRQRFYTLSTAFGGRGIHKVAIPDSDGVNRTLMYCIANCAIPTMKSERFGTLINNDLYAYPLHAYPSK